MWAMLCATYIYTEHIHAHTDMYCTYTLYVEGSDSIVVVQLTDRHRVNCVSTVLQRHFTRQHSTPYTVIVVT